MTLLDDYEKQYSTLIAEITSQIAQIKLLRGDQRINSIQRLNDNIKEAKELLEQFGLEIRDAPASSISGLRNRHSCYQVELKRLQEDFTTQRANDFPDSLSIEDFDDSFQDQSQRRLLDNSERLERTGKQLNEGYKIVIETENIANQTLRGLSDQRDTIQRARARLRDTDGDLYRSNRIANSMIMRSIRERAILYGIALIFVIVLVTSIYLSFR